MGTPEELRQGRCISIYLYKNMIKISRLLFHVNICMKVCFKTFTLSPRSQDLNSDYRGGRQIENLKLVCLDHFQTIFHSLCDTVNIIMVNVSF